MAPGKFDAGDIRYGFFRCEALMNNTVKILLYAVVLICFVTFLCLFVADYRRLNAPVPAPQNAAVSDAPGDGTVATGRAPSKRVGHLMTYGALAFVSLIGLGLVIGREMARFFGHRAEQLLMSDDGEGLRSPEYEMAEQVWANGNHLEAIQLMRDYLKENPRELHAALRIAEIYEKDLGNHLAAALEYEEVIKHKLPPERWGWAAIHLANLYSGKLNKPEQAMELLRRIVNEYGQTAAAKKARERLSLEEPQSAAIPSDASAIDPNSNLPPGFSLKK